MLQEKVDASSKARVGQGSREQYANSAVRLLQWLSVNEAAVMNRLWVQAVAQDVGVPFPDDGVLALEDKFKKAMKKRLLDFDLALLPLAFGLFATTMFLQWIHSLSSGYDAANTHRAAVRGLFKDFKQQLPAKWDDETSTAFQGLKRQAAKKKAEGKAAAKGKGKKPMEFALLCQLSRLMWKSGDKRFFFTILYMLLCWNLMSRSKNVTTVCLQHLDWKDDALTILFCQTKTDQSGDRAHNRHVYANPLKPEICPILALGVFLLLTDFSEDDVKLFGGGHQYSHFSTAFKALVVQNLDELQTWIQSVADWGTHSFRKGSATFACSGSSQGAHISAVSNRCGWKQPGVQDTYLVFSDAGDQVVGRIVSGLPLDSPSFSTLPPMFLNPESEDVKSAIRLCFPSVVDKLAPRVLVFCLASLIHHRHWLQETVPKENPLWNVALFKDVALQNRLADDVVCRLPNFVDDVRVTGLPPHVAHLRALDEVRQEMSGFVSMINTVGDRVTRDVLRGLDDRQIESHVTPTSLQQHIADAFSKVGLDKLVAKLSAGSVEHLPMARAEEARVPELQTYMWGGKLGRLLPADFNLPASGPRDMWQLYIAGNAAQGVRPLRLISGDHVCDKNVKKRFSDFKTLMRMIERKVRDDGRWSDEATIANAEAMFEVGKVAVQLGVKSEKGYSRRNGGLAWTTILKVLREGKLVSKVKKSRPKRSNRRLDSSESGSEDEEEESDVRSEVDVRPLKKR